MLNYDLSPFYRSTVGFDRLFSLLDQATSDGSPGYPPYNIERTGENAYRVEIAVAGFKPEDLTIEAKENVLTVQGRKAANDETRRFLPAPEHEHDVRQLLDELDALFRQR